MPAPAPIQGGSRLFCPMVDVAKIEAMPEEEAHDLTRAQMMCGWKRRVGRKGALKAYRRHWRRAHWEPFRRETKASLSYRYPPRYMPGVQLTATVSKPYARDDDDAQDRD
jgi:hypothetical protein